MLLPISVRNRNDSVIYKEREEGLGFIESFSYFIESFEGFISFKNRTSKHVQLQVKVGIRNDELVVTSFKLIFLIT